MGTPQTRASLKYVKEHFEKITLTLKPEIAKKFRENAEPSQAKFFEKILNYFLENKKILEEKDEQIDEKTNYNQDIDIETLKYNEFINKIESSNDKFILGALFIGVIAGFVLGKILP